MKRAFVVQAISTLLSFGVLSWVLLTAPDQNDLTPTRFLVGVTLFFVIMVGGPALELWRLVRADRRRMNEPLQKMTIKRRMINYTAIVYRAWDAGKKDHG